MKFHNNKAVAVGEAMIEMAIVEDARYCRNFAGDTFNTAWHMAQVLGEKAEIGFVTKVGTDSLSEAFVESLDRDGLDIAAIGRVAGRTMGLYLIELNGVERSFHYWRSASAARLLADDETWLAHVLNGAGLIHLSGITLAILSPDARKRLLGVLVQARADGARVSFDPNIRPTLWSSGDEIRETIAMFLPVTDIALPSFADEHQHWGDASPAQTLVRFADAGVSEIIVKDGANPTVGLSQGQNFIVETPPVSGVCDTSGAGDAFNAGYLAGRLLDQKATEAIQSGQKLSAEVICHFGARIPNGNVPSIE